jgi:hypothetical protein
MDIWQPNLSLVECARNRYQITVLWLNPQLKSSISGSIILLFYELSLKYGSSFLHEIEKVVRVILLVFLLICYGKTLRGLHMSDCNTDVNFTDIQNNS